MDADEPNDAAPLATDVGTYTDEPNTDVWRARNLSSAADEDWLTFVATDDPGDASPLDLRMTLTGIPAGSDYRVAVYADCTTGVTSGSCVSGSSTSTVIPATGLVSGCTSTSAAGGQLARFNPNACGGSGAARVWVRVWSTTWGGSCADYSLRIQVR